jgi:hypothetical protein
VKCEETLAEDQTGCERNRRASLSGSSFPCRQHRRPNLVIATMKILVGVKRVVDYAVKVRVAKGTVDLKNVKQSMNPFCEVCNIKLNGMTGYCTK